MKTLCITGPQTAQLSDLASVFFNAGMKPPLSATARSHVEVDVNTWHKRVQNALRHQKPVGRLWEQVASDLLLANLKSECWGWSAVESVWALDFWAELEPGIHFVLVCISPEALLAECMISDQGQNSEQECLQRWYDYHRAMLAFYLKHPERCLVVDSQQAQANPQALIELASERWDLPLVADKVSAAEPGYSEPDRLARYLARQVIEAHQGFGDTGQSLEALYSELCAAQQPLVSQQQSYATEELHADASDAEPEADGDTQLTQVIREYQQLYAATQETPLQGAQAQALTQLESTQQENEWLKLQLEQMQEALNSAQQQPNENTQHELEDSQQENELLLLQLHQVQEELEHYFLAHQKLQQHSEEADARWQRMLQRNPDYSNYQAVQIQASATGSEALSWRFEQLDIAGRELAQLNLNTRIERDMAVIELTRDGEDYAPLLIWPAMYADQRTLTLCAPGDSDTIEPNVQLLQLLTQSDWQLVQRLPRLLEQALGEGDLSAEQQQRYRNVLNELQEALDSLPPTLRFDQVTLRNAQINPDYEHLWLDLEHAGWGDERREKWSLRLSCANVGPDQFGTHPKIEIPEQNGQWLESWFAESRDDFGPKWELRFALPDAMDIGVWNKLSERDQALMVSAIRQLPAMLEHLQAQGMVLARNWQDWHQLIDDAQRIHKALMHATTSTRIGSDAVL